MFDGFNEACADLRREPCGLSSSAAAGIWNPRDADFLAWNFFCVETPENEAQIFSFGFAKEAAASKIRVGRFLVEFSRYFNPA